MSVRTLTPALLWPALALATPTEQLLLPNGEPIVGVYYYPWFAGPPSRHAGWTPEFPYDDLNNPQHRRAVLQSITDDGSKAAAQR